VSGPRLVPRTVAHAWLFDVDGVLADPSTKRIEQPAILAELAARLGRGEPVGANTGRSLAFVEERVLGPLEAAIADPALRRLVFVAAEKGAATLVYGTNGERRRRLHADLTVPGFEELRADVAALIAEGYADAMFVDPSKQTMISVEMVDGLAVEAYRRRQLDLLPDLERIVRRHGLTEQVQIDASRIAVDLQHPATGKALGARAFVAFLRERRIAPQQFVTFGDSPSDLAMAAELDRRGFPVELVFVGGREQLELDAPPSFPVTYTAALCDDGTVEYLRQHA
jgi:hypothetical protein